MKKILVTGATGFIGNYVVIQLVKEGYTVIATSSNVTKAENYSWFKSVQYIPFKLEEFSNLIDYKSYFHNPDLVIHLAWEGLPNYKSLSHFETSLPRHYAFLKNLILNGINDITVTGTCFEYGMREGCLTEEMYTIPNNSYGLAKDTLRKFLQEFEKANHFYFKWLRLFYMYGHGQNPKSLFAQLDSAITAGKPTFNMSGGEQIRDYMSVEKIAEQIIDVALQNKVIGLFNCCSGKPISVRKLVENYLYERNSSMKLNLGFYPYPDYEPMQFWGNNDKILSVIKNSNNYK